MYEYEIFCFKYELFSSMFFSTGGAFVIIYLMGWQFLLHMLHVLCFWCTDKLSDNTDWVYHIWGKVSMIVVTFIDLYSSSSEKIVFSFHVCWSSWHSPQVVAFRWLSVWLYWKTCMSVRFISYLAIIKSTSMTILLFTRFIYLCFPESFLQLSNESPDYARE